MVLKRFFAVNEDHGNFLIEFFKKMLVFENIDFAPSEGMGSLQSTELRLDFITQTTVRLGIDYNFNHGSREWILGEEAGRVKEVPPARRGLGLNPPRGVPLDSGPG
jgi:hypothetical protein